MIQAMCLAIANVIDLALMVIIIVIVLRWMGVAI